MVFQPGKSGNPSGRKRGFERVAREEADRWAEQMGITGEHAGMRAAMRVAFARIDDSETEDRDRLGYLKFAVDRFAGKPRETIEFTETAEFSDADRAEEAMIVMREMLNRLPPEERAKLLADPAPDSAIQ